MAHLDKKSKIPKGKYKGLTVDDVFSNNGKQGIFSLLKEGYQFTDDYLSQIGIKKVIRDERFENVLVEHEKIDKVYKKDTMKVDRIISELQTIANMGENKMDYFETNEKFQEY